MYSNPISRFKQKKKGEISIDLLQNILIGKSELEQKLRHQQNNLLSFVGNVIFLFIEVQNRA